MEHSRQTILNEPVVREKMSFKGKVYGRQTHSACPGVDGGCTLIFSSYVGPVLASTLHPIKISGISTPQKYLNF